MKKSYHGLFQEHEFDDDEAETQSLKVNKRNLSCTTYLSLYCCIAGSPKPTQRCPIHPNPIYPPTLKSTTVLHTFQMVYFVINSINIVCTIQLTLSSSECSPKKGDLWEKRHNSDRPPNGQRYCKEKVIQTPSALWNPHNKSSSLASLINKQTNITGWFLQKSVNPWPALRLASTQTRPRNWRRWQPDLFSGFLFIAIYPESKIQIKRLVIRSNQEYANLIFFCSRKWDCTCPCVSVVEWVSPM